MINRVVLQNFISHKDTDIRLGQGVTVFVGPNGAGKSSVIDGITFALYGEHVRGPNDALVREGTMGAAAMVEFGVQSRTYLAERKLDKKGKLSGAVLKETTNGVTRQVAAGERKQFDESTTSEEVAKVLGLDYERMKVAAIVQQGELDSIIRNFTPKEFKELVNSLIGIDGLEIAYQNMSQVIGSFRSHLRDEYVYDDTNLGSIEGAILEREGSLRQNKELLGKSEAALRVFRRHETDFDEWLKKAEPKREKYAQLSNSVGNLVSYVDQQRTRLQTHRDELTRIIPESLRYLSVVAKGAEVSKAVESVKHEITDCDREIGELREAIAGLRPLKGKPAQLAKTISEARKSLTLIGGAGDLKNELAEVDEKLRKTDGALRSVSRERGKLEANSETAKKLEFKDNICPVCGSRVETINPIFDLIEIEKHLEEHKQEIARLERTKSNLRSRRDRLGAKTASIKAARTFLDNNAIGNEDDVKKLVRDRRELLTKLRQVPAVEKRLTKAKGRKVKAVEKQEMLNSKSNQISEGKTFLKEHGVSSRSDVKGLSQEKSELGRTISRLPGDVETLRDSRNPKELSVLAIDAHSRALLEGIRALSEEAAGFDEKEYQEKVTIYKNLTTKIIPEQLANEKTYGGKAEEDERELAKLKDAQDKLRRASAFATLLTRIRERVYHRDGPVPSSLRSWALSQIGLKASEFARRFNIGVSTIQLKEKANHVSIECYGPRGVIETTALSGGEKVAIALALRFGMAYVMGGYKLDFVILDEPTIHLDAERRATMVDIVSGLGGEDSPIKQTVIITHDSDIFEDAEVDAVYRFEKTSEGTTVTLVP